MREIVGMYKAVRSPLPGGIDICAEIFEQVAIDHVNVTGFRQRYDRPWDAIYKPPELASGSLYFFFGRGSHSGTRHYYQSFTS